MSLLGAAGASVTGLDTDIERVLDLGGILVFAISGGLTAVRKEYDVVGVVALSLVTALGGGILRDLLLGDTPPVALRDTNYLVVPLVAAAIVSLFHGLVDQHLRRPGLVFDAAGLGLFAVTGTVKALSLGSTRSGPSCSVSSPPSVAVCSVTCWRTTCRPCSGPTARCSRSPPRWARPWWRSRGGPTSTKGPSAR